MFLYVRPVTLLFLCYPVFLVLVGIDFGKWSQKFKSLLHKPTTATTAASSFLVGDGVLERSREKDFLIKMKKVDYFWKEQSQWHHHQSASSLLLPSKSRRGKKESFGFFLRFGSMKSSSCAKFSSEKKKEFSRNNSRPLLKSVYWSLLFYGPCSQLVVIRHPKLRDERKSQTYTEMDGHDWHQPHAPEIWGVNLPRFQFSRRLAK